ncbi:MAG: hypothetical protein R3C53_27340 [Pirellulaceae bacterium]
MQTATVPRIFASLDGEELSARVGREAISAACAAPSADNNQPWKFRLDASRSRIEVFCDLEHRLPSDVDGMFDLLSLGAAIENMALQVSARGRQAIVSTLDKSSYDTQQLRHVASLDYAQQTDEPTDPLLAFVDARQTTRFPFSTRRIEDRYLEQIEKASIRDNSVRLEWEQDRAKIHNIASLVALSDSLRFRYRAFHEELHRQLRLTPQHVETSRDGLDYRTLGLPPGAKLVLRALRPWATMSFLNRFGLSKLLSVPSMNLVRRSGAIGFVYLSDRSTQSMIAGGRAMQRIWLQATQLGLAIQPLGSLPIFLANESLPSELSPLGERIQMRSKQLTPAPDHFLQMAFRIGYCKRRPSVRVTP